MPPPALERFVAYPRVEEVLGRGENKASAKVGREGLQVDVRALPPGSFGAAMQYFTGSKDHNVAIRTRAVKMGLKLSEYGLFRVEDDARVAGETEAGVYEALGLAWIPPELRENCGEIEAPPKAACPNWWSCAKSAATSTCIPPRPTAAPRWKKWPRRRARCGYEYIAITDHSKALAMANGLDEARVVAFARQVRELNREGGAGIRMFSGHRMRHPERRRAWIWPTTRWPSWTW